MTPPKEPQHKTKPIPVRLSVDLLAKIEEAAQLLEMSSADVIRLAAKIGLADLARINYDISGLISEKLSQEKPAPEVGARRRL